MSKKLDTSDLRLGGVAFLVGALAAIVTVFTLFLRKKKLPDSDGDHYDGWEEGLGV